MIIKSTFKVAEIFIYPPPAEITLDPITSLEDKPIKSKYPLSDVKIEEEISGSFGSWVVKKVISVGALHAKVLKEIETTGEKGTHDKDPVFPPTQLPQLSVKAVPFGDALQSSG